MIKKILFSILGLILGAISIYVVNFYTPFFSSVQNIPILSGLGQTKEVIGFLPYWQTGIAPQSYKGYITTLTYFGLALDSDGSILKLSTPTSLEPGWNALSSGKVTPYLDKAKQNNETTSLLIFSGNVDTINSAMQTPTKSAKNLVGEVEPLMKQYGFTDLNLDIEYTAQASPAARVHFTDFVKTVRQLLPNDQTLTVEVVSLDAIKPNLIDVKTVGNYADHLVIMAYDYHSPDSFVTGPVAPLSGAGISSEIDVTTAVEKALEIVPSNKIILGMPLYGYEWESLSPDSRSAVIPHSGVIASNHRAEELLNSCTTCSVTPDKDAVETHISYFDNDTQTYHQLFIPTAQSTQEKINLTTQNHLPGVALWALGYEGKTILGPLKNYLN